MFELLRYGGKEVNVDDHVRPDLVPIKEVGEVLDLDIPMRRSATFSSKIDNLNHSFSQKQQFTITIFNFLP